MGVNIFLFCRSI